VGIKEINKLGKAINSIKDRYNNDTEKLLDSIPETIDIIKSKKLGSELVYFSDYEKHLNIFREVINQKNQAWGEMIKLIEVFAIKEQGKKNKLINNERRYEENGKI